MYQCSQPLIETLGYFGFYTIIISYICKTCNLLYTIPELTELQFGQHLNEGRYCLYHSPSQLVFTLMKETFLGFAFWGEIPES